MKKEKMNKVRWVWGQRYRLSADGKGLLKYINPEGDFYHIHSNELTSLERWKHRALIALKGDVQFA